MNENNIIDEAEFKNQEIRILLQKARKLCYDFFNVDYVYSTLEASQQLGLESELIRQLSKEYVTQIMHSHTLFQEYLNILKKSKLDFAELDFIPLRELAHRHLGVARNLRIKDFEDVLESMMSEDDLEYLQLLLDVLKACAIRLEPATAYAALK
jgi:hypothetical protein